MVDIGAALATCKVSNGEIHFEMNLSNDDLRDVYEKPDASFMNDGLAIWEFVHAVQPGDVIFVKSGISKIIGRGIVKSEYIYDESYEDFRNKFGVAESEL